MRTIYLEAGTRDAIASVVAEIERLLAAGKSLAVTVAEDGEWITPDEVAWRLGCTAGEVERLIRADELEAQTLGDPGSWQVSLASVIDLEARRDSRRRRIVALETCAAQLRAAS